jgi:hypothetical protein
VFLWLPTVFVAAEAATGFVAVIDRVQEIVTGPVVLESPNAPN